MQSSRRTMSLLIMAIYTCIYLLMEFSGLDAKSNLKKNKYFNSTILNIGLVSGIYKPKTSLNSPLLAASIIQKNKVPTPIKPVVQLLLNNSHQEAPPLSCPGTLTINGSISIVESKNVAITVNSLSDITVVGAVQISIPAGGLFTINGKPYVVSPIPGLTLVQNSSSGVRIDCNDAALAVLCGVYIGSGITLDVQGDMVMTNNAGTSSSSISDTFGVFNNGTIRSSGAIKIAENRATSNGSSAAYGVYNNGTIQTSGSGSITISDNQAMCVSNFAIGFWNNATVQTTGSGGVIISENIATSNSGSGAYGILNDGAITAHSTMTINENQATNTVGNFAIGAYNDGTATAQGAMAISDNLVINTAGDFAFGFYHSGRVTASGAITIDGNSVTLHDSNGDAYGFYNGGIIETPGAITMSNNQASNNVGSFAIGIYNDGEVTATSVITISDNRAISGSVGAYGILNSGMLKTSGVVTMINNQASSNSGDFAIGVYNSGTIAASGNIAINNNQATGGSFLCGTFIDGASIIKTNENCVITVMTTLGSNQNFNSGTVAITNATGTALPFSSFTIKVNNVTYDTYGAISPSGSVILNNANQGS